MKNQLSNGPIQEEASEEKLLSSGGPTQFGSIFVLFLGERSHYDHVDHVGLRQERAFCSLKMSSIHNCAFSEFGCPRFLGRC